MFISSISVRNYKSFLEAPELVLRPGFNIITGQNNSGKTALLEALSLNFPFAPHKSVRTVPNEGVAPPQISEIDFSLTVTANELKEFMFAGRQSITIFLPVVNFGSEFAISNRITNSRELVDWFLKTANHTFKVRLTRQADGKQRWSIPSVPSFGCYSATALNNNNFNAMRVSVSQDGDVAIHQDSVGADINNDIGLNVTNYFARHVYLFKAERFGLARYTFGPNEVLQSDASNLPEVLNRLQGNRERFATFVNFVRSVLPQIKDVTVLPAGTSEVEIRVWTGNLGRIDLTKPLDACGTGIGQVLAILYIAVNSPNPRVILIDEPQSFLHPGAARKLIQILRTYPKHQYICATHSAMIISSTEPETITVTRLEDDRTEVKQVDPGEPANLRTCLAEVGARLSDVFGADQILWVEGRTEEACFPIILQELAGRRLMGTVIIGLRSTGELEGGDAERIVDIYSLLSKAKTLVPPTIGFLFDQEGRNQETRDDIIRKTSSMVKFLPRRMYENYLLDARAIARVVGGLDTGHAGGYAPEEVQRELEAECQKIENFRPFPIPSNQETWCDTIHAAKVLKAVFGKMSEHRIRYDKVRDGQALTRDIVANCPDRLDELSRFLVELLPE
jgi:predicted ATPase